MSGERASVSYRAYGLSILSDIELPGVERTSAPPTRHDLRIMLCEPVRIGATDGQWIYRSPGRDHLELTIGGTLRITVRNGDLLQIRPDSRANPDDVAGQVVSTGIAVACYQRGLLPIHASAALTPDGAVFLTGPSGIGKSTTLAALMQHGLRPLCDDIVPVESTSEGLRLSGGGASLRLWQDAVADLGLNPDTAKPQRPEKAKYIFPLATPDDQPVRLRRGFVIQPEAGAKVCVQPLSQAQAFEVYAQRSFRRRTAEEMGRQDQVFRLASALAAQVPLTRIIRPTTGFGAHAMAALILEHLKDQPAPENGTESPRT